MARMPRTTRRRPMARMFLLRCRMRPREVTSNGRGRALGIAGPRGSGKTDAGEASMDDDARRWTRRGVLGLGVTVPLSVRLGFAAGLAVLPLTPECADADEAPTPPSIEGPYFKPRSPERRVLREPGIPGTPLVVTGRVLSVGGVAVAKALVDVWQADAS